MDPCLIVYYSRSGVTATVARAIAEVCGAEHEALRAVQPISGVSGYARAAWQALSGQPAPIAPLRHSADAYPLLLLGTPVWIGHMSSPIRQYILQQRPYFRDVALFCTMGGSGGESVMQAMARLCQREPLATLCLREQDVRAGRHVDAVRDFAASLALRRLQRGGADGQAAGQQAPVQPPASLAPGSSPVSGSTP
jgi:flavodoxin